MGLLRSCSPLHHYILVILIIIHFNVIAIIIMMTKRKIKSQRFSFLLPPTSYPARTALLVTVFLCQVIIIPIIIIIFPLIVIVIMFAKLVELEIDIELPSSLDRYLQRGDPRNPERKRR